MHVYRPILINCMDLVSSYGPAMNQRWKAELKGQRPLVVARLAAFFLTLKASWRYNTIEIQNPVADR